MGLNINIIIAGRNYPMSVKDTQEEEAMRRAAEEVNRLITQFQQEYEADKQDVLAMCALQFAFKLGLNSLQENEQSIVQTETINNLTELIDKYL